MKPDFLKPISSAINAVLRLDPESESRLQQLAGKVVYIELLPLHFSFYCVFSDKRIELHKHYEHEADTQITGTPLQMLGVVLHKSGRQKFFADDVKITGDAELGQSVIELFDELQIDWEEHASKVMGDVLTQNLSQFVTSVRKWLQDSEESFTENVSEFLHEEKQWLPAREALDDFFTDIDTLRMDVDRAEARISQLLKNPEREDNP